MNKLFQYRLVMIVGQLSILLVNSIWFFWQPISQFIWLVCTSYLIIIIGLHIWLRSFSIKINQSSLLMLLDLLIWGLFFYVYDGVSNPLIWCLLIPSVLSALSQSVKFTWFLTIMANVFYGLLWISISKTSGHALHGESMQQHITGMWLGFIAVSVLLTWATTTLMQRINKKNSELIHYEKQRQGDENILKMATLATSLAHELGTPLASIKLLVDELKLTINSPQQSKDLNMLDSQVMRCKNVLAELTAVSDKSRLDDSKSQNVIEFIQQVILAVKGTQCMINIGEDNSDGAIIIVDTLLHLACLNVINNSIAADAKEITININTYQDRIGIFVFDDGVGDTHRNQNGMGIGLELSNRILISIGGQLTLNRNENGAQCILEIPLIKGSIDE